MSRAACARSCPAVRPSDAREDLITLRMSSADFTASLLAVLGDFHRWRPHSSLCIDVMYESFQTDKFPRRSHSRSLQKFQLEVGCSVVNLSFTFDLAMFQLQSGHVLLSKSSSDTSGESLLRIHATYVQNIIHFLFNQHQIPASIESRVSRGRRCKINEPSAEGCGDNFVPEVRLIDNYIGKGANMQTSLPTFHPAPARNATSFPEQGATPLCT